MASAPFNRGFDDYGNGRTTPPKSYYSLDWLMEWHAGYAAAKAESEARAKAVAAEEAIWRDRPPSERALRDLVQSVGEDAAEKIHALIATMIEESKA